MWFKHILDKINDCEDLVSLCDAMSPCDDSEGTGTVWYKYAVRTQWEAAALWRPFDSQWDYGTVHPVLGRRRMKSGGASPPEHLV